MQEMKQPLFLMYSDISHVPTGDLGKRVKSELVLQNSAVDKHKNVTLGKPEKMLDCIQEFRTIFVTDFQIRNGFSFIQVNDDGEQLLYNEDKLPSDVAVAALLNPLYGGKIRVVLFALFGFWKKN